MKRKKESARRAILREIWKLAPEEREEKTQKILSNLAAFKEATTPSTIASFLPLPCHPNIEPFNQSAQERMFFPHAEDWIEGRTVHPEAPMEFDQSSVVRTPEVDLLLMPCAAVSSQGIRLGWSAGFYDRYLCRTRPKHVVAVIYHFQLKDQVPYQKHDCIVDAAITEAGVRWIIK